MDDKEYRELCKIYGVPHGTPLEGMLEDNGPPTFAASGRHPWTEEQQARMATEQMERARGGMERQGCADFLDVTRWKPQPTDLIQGVFRWEPERGPRIYADPVEGMRPEGWTVIIEASSLVYWVFDRGPEEKWHLLEDRLNEFRCRPAHSAESANLLIRYCGVSTRNYVVKGIEIVSEYEFEHIYHR
jgi:hypothetical protein